MLDVFPSVKFQNHKPCMATCGIANSNSHQPVKRERKPAKLAFFLPDKARGLGTKPFKQLSKHKSDKFS